MCHGPGSIYISGMELGLLTNDNSVTADNLELVLIQTLYCKHFIYKLFITVFCYILFKDQYSQNVIYESKVFGHKFETKK